MRRLTFESLEPRRVMATLPMGDVVMVNDFSAGVQQLNAESEAVAVLPDGGYVAAFEGRGAGDLHGIYLRQFNADGTPADDHPTAELVNTTFNGEQFSPSVAAFDDGSFVVVWAGRGTGDRYGVFAQWYDADGDKVSPETRVNSTVGGRQMNPRVATDAFNRTFISWHGVGDGDVQGVYIRAFDDADANFAALGEEILVNAETDGVQSDADVTVAANGVTMVTWNSGHVAGSAATLFARRFDATGNPTTGDLEVHSVTGANQSHASVAALATGEFVVAWSDRSAGAGDWNVMARRLSAAGQPVGNAFQLNETATGQQQHVKIAATPTGGFLAVWSDIDANGVSAVAREFDALGEPVDGEFLVSTANAGATSNNQMSPSVATRGRDAVIVWSGGSAVDLDAVFARQFTIDTTGGPNIAPVLDPIATQQARRGVEFVLPISAIDPNGDTVLTFTLDPSVSPNDAVIIRTGDTTAEIRWTPGTSDLPSRMFRVIVTDDGAPGLTDMQDFVVNVSQSAGSL